MKLLVLGGTKFLGRHAVAYALEQGHEVTTFTRGQTNPELFPEAEHLLGDRDGGLDALRDRLGRRRRPGLPAGRGRLGRPRFQPEWDGVVDTSGYVPRIVRQSAELLRDAVERYVFVSSISVYADFSQPVDESTAVAQLEDPDTEEILPNYGALKAACEDVVEEVYGDRSTRVRAGLIVGPYDPTDRFTYWPRRIAAGGDVLAPGKPEAPTQFVDSRDLAAWLVELALHGPGGVFNATGPASALTMRELFERSRAELGSDANFVWVDDDAVLAAGVEPWSELPLWLPGNDYAGMARADVSRALAAGLSFRPVEETVRDTYAWDREQPGARPTLTREKEAAVLSPARGA